MHSGKRYILATGLVGLFSQPVAAQDLGARALAMGGTGRADASDAGVVPDNIATFSLAPQYNFLTGVGFGPEDYFLTRGSVMDSRTSQVSLGASWFRSTETPILSGEDLPGWKTPVDKLRNPTVRQGILLGVAYPFLERRISIGVMGRYDWQTSQRDEKVSAYNLGFNLAGRPIPSLTLATAVHNVLQNDYESTPRTLDMAARWDAGPYFGIEMDGVFPLSATETDAPIPFKLGGGVSASLVEVAAIRAGWSTEEGSYSLTGGVGLLSEHASLDYGLRYNLGLQQFWHGLDLRVML